MVPAEGIGIFRGIENTQVKLLIFRGAKNAEDGKIAPYWKAGFSFLPPVLWSFSRTKKDFRPDE
jgi:hypothetical protein